MESLMAFIMTIPGVPCIYYGDEIAMPGGNDPDNRRMMIFDGLTENQIKTRNITSKLTALRTNHLSLLYGDTYVLWSDKSDFIFVRKYFNDVVISCFHKGLEKSVVVELPEFLMIPEMEANFGGQFILDGNLLTVNFKEDFEVLTTKK
jgi:cyclomaltodextrinase